VSVDARSHREARLHPMVTALIAAFAIRWAVFYAGNAAESSPYFVPLMYLLPIAVAALAVRMLMSHKSLELPASWRTRLLELRDRVAARLSRRSGATSTGSGPRP
ncbi:MAG TPA: LPS export ABC transporter permease LptF, partial [Mycoplana sp.]|nr:LPS export ABC transporter permease LptF [Mycoplana sp.]